MTETAATRTKTRRVKDHILDRYLKLAERVDDKGEGDLSDNETSKYWELTTIFAKSVLPRTQEIAGDPDNRTPIPILATPNVQPDNSHEENTGDVQENPGSTGGDISQQDNIDSPAPDSAITE